jgi:hypothetical protein
MLVKKDGTIPSGSPLFDEASIDVVGQSQDANTEQVPLARLLSQFVAETNARQGLSEVSSAPVPNVDESEIEQATSPGMPAAMAAAEAVQQKHGDIHQLLAAIGPFLWSLEEAQKWVRDHGRGDATAEAHVRALGLLAKILAQLQARVDEIK